MKKSIILILLITLFVSGCEGTPATKQSLTSAPVTAAAATDTPAATSTPVPTPTPAGSAALSEIVNQVQYRPDPNADFSPAANGDTLPLLGDLQTGAESSARLDILPDGTIIRIGENTSLHLAELAAKEDGLLTSIQFFFGNLWVVLNGGQLDVQTQNGTASVRGSYMSVTYSQENSGVGVTCLEGHCTLENEYGTISLTGGQAASMLPDQAPSDLRDMLPEEYAAWAAFVPEAEDIIPPDKLPIPTPDAEASHVTIYNSCTEDWIWSFEGYKSFEISIAPHTVYKEELPPGDYNVTRWWESMPDDTESLTIPAGSDYYSTSQCGYDAEGTSYYSITNNNNENWIWIFNGVTNFVITVVPGQTVTGTLRGDYNATYWWQHTPDITYDIFIPAGTNFVRSSP